jgi:hypothetical protein
MDRHPLAAGVTPRSTSKNLQGSRPWLTLQRGLTLSPSGRPQEFCLIPKPLQRPDCLDKIYALSRSASAPKAIARASMGLP